MLVMIAGGSLTLALLLVLWAVLSGGGGGSDKMEEVEALAPRVGPARTSDVEMEPAAVSPTPEVAELREWLLTHARIPASRVDPLLAKLAEEWVEDLPALRHSIGALQATLPAAPYKAIVRGLESSVYNR